MIKIGGLATLGSSGVEQQPVNQDEGPFGEWEAVETPFVPDWEVWGYLWI